MLQNAKQLSQEGPSGWFTATESEQGFSSACMLDTSRPVAVHRSMAFYTFRIHELHLDLYFRPKRSCLVPTVALGVSVALPDQ